MSKISKRNRILAAALGFVATTGACGTFGTFATFENRALFGDETSSAGGRQIVVEPKGGELAKPSACKAFLVAADDYGDAANPLPCTKNDVKALKARLEALGFETTVLETGGNPQNAPTKGMIERRFKQFVGKLRSGDFAIVYLSGHGIQQTDTDKSFFAPIDVDREDLFATSVSIDEMLEALKSSDATFRWLIVDACRDDPLNPADDADGSAFKGASKSFGAKALGDIANVPDSVALLRSCQAGRRSYEGGGPGAESIKNGFFTLSLLEALDDENSRADANGDGVLTFSETFEYVSRRTDELARESYGVSQIPNLSGSITNFALLDELLIDGLTKSKWNEANGLYQEACVFRVQKKWREALAKIKKAREINKSRKEYETAEAEIQAWVDSLAVGEANALYQAAVNALLADDLTTAKSKCEASLKAFETDAAQTLLKTINDKIAAASRPKPDPEPPTPPRTTVTQPPRQVAQNGGSTSGTETTSTGRTSSANGTWSGEYAEGTAKSLTIKGETYTFHYCPTGSFTMGSPESEEDRGSDERQHRVTLDGFWMLETEVTQAMWKSIMGSNPSYFSSSGGASSRVSGIDTLNFPVEQVSWYDCQDFIAKLNTGGYAPSGFEFRLPTEAEWEYACRANTPGPYAGSSLDALGWYGTAISGGNSGGHTHEVGTKAPNAWGLYDMHGNVREWCLDWYYRDDYEKLINEQNLINTTTDSRRVVRGGCWDLSAKYCRSAKRGGNGPTGRSFFNGFRLALVRSSSSSK